MNVTFMMVNSFFVYIAWRLQVSLIYNIIFSFYFRGHLQAKSAPAELRDPHPLRV